MDLSTDIDARASAAKILAASDCFGESEQIAWACIERKPGRPASAQALDDLAWCLVESVERKALPEFVFSLLADGAPAGLLDDDGRPLWRGALASDAMLREDERFAWMIVGRLSLGAGFASDERLPLVRKACAECIGELEALFSAQDEHYKQCHDPAKTSALYAVLDARHDCAMLSLINAAGAIEQTAKRRKL